MAVAREVTQLLVDWSNGDKGALDELIPIVLGELQRCAHNQLRREHSNHTLQTTALVHEAYIRLAGYKNPPCHHRAHFFAIAAQVMRRILVEHARGRGRLRRGGDRQRVALDEEILLLSESLGDSRHLDLLALDQAMTELEAEYPRKGKVVEMRFFGEMNNKQIAEVLNVSSNTVIRDWNFAEAWLRLRLGV